MHVIDNMILFIEGAEKSTANVDKKAVRNKAADECNKENVKGLTNII